jgi:hypothetical protein
MIEFVVESSRRRLAVIRRCPAPLTAVAASLALCFGSQPVSTHADQMGTADYTLTTTTALPAPTVPVPGTVFGLTGTVTSGSTSVVVSNTSELAVGDAVTGQGIPSGATINSINTNGTGFVLSQPVTGSGSESLSFTSVPSPQIAAIINPAGGVVTPATTSTQGPLLPISGSGFTKGDVWDFLASGTDPNTGKPIQGLGLSFYGQGLAAGGVLNFSLNVANANDPPQIVSQTPGVTITLDSTSSSSSSSSSSSTGSSGATSTDTENSVPEPLSVLLWAGLAAAGFVRARVMRQKHRVASSG